MTVERAIEILTPWEAKFSPSEYAEALQMARKALETLNRKEKE